MSAVLGGMRFAVLAIVLAWPRGAGAEVDRVVLIELPANLEAAVRTALEPWQIDLVVSGAEPPGSSMPSSSDRASEIAGTEHAGAAVWLAADPSGSALWIFDAESGRTTARRLSSPPPYDDATAASVALSIKTLLRFSAVAPPAERYQVVAAVEPRREPESGRPPSVVAMLARFGLRRRETGAGAFEPRFGVGARLAIPAFGLRVALSSELRLGPGESVDGADFIGHFSDLGIGVRAGLELARGGLRLEPSLGASLHFTAIDGSIPSRASTAHAERRNPMLDAGVRLAADVSRGLTLGVEIEGGYALRQQRYLVGGAEVLRVPATETEISAIVSVPLP
jgi:hypothetical protein